MKFIHYIPLLLCFLGCKNSDLSPKDFISYYSFNGNTNDLKGTNNAISIYRARLTDDKNGNANSAYYFDGNSYIEFPKPAIKNDFTVSLWAMIESIPTEGTIRTAMSIGSSGGDQLVNISNNYYGVSGWALTSYNEDGSNLVVTPNTLSSMVAQKWVHLAFTRDGHNFKAYIDGKQIGSLPVEGKSAGYGYGTQRFYVGNRHTGQGFIGTIDEVKIYKRALSAEEIGQLSSN